MRLIKRDQIRDVSMMGEMAMSTQERPSQSASPSSGNTPSQHVFRGCNTIQKYEMLEKLGEGTFG